MIYVQPPNGILFFHETKDKEVFYEWIYSVSMIYGIKNNNSMLMFKGQIRGLRIYDYQDFLLPVYLPILLEQKRNKRRLKRNYWKNNYLWEIDEIGEEGLVMGVQFFWKPLFYIICF